MPRPMPKEVFVVMTKHPDGELRGYGSNSFLYWPSQDLAERQLKAIQEKFPILADTWVVVPSVIMTSEEYKDLQETLTDLRSNLNWMEDRECALVSERDGLIDELNGLIDELNRPNAQLD